MKLTDAIKSVAIERREMASPLSRSCLVWAIVTSAVSERARVLTQKRWNILPSIWMPEPSIDQAMKTMQEVGQLINQDKRLEALYLSAILKGYEDPTPVDVLAYIRASEDENGLTCEQTLNLLYRYLKLTQGVEGADFVFVRLRELVRQMHVASQMIFG